MKKKKETKVQATSVARQKNLVVNRCHDAVGFHSPAAATKWPLYLQISAVVHRVPMHNRFAHIMLLSILFIGYVTSSAI